MMLGRPDTADVLEATAAALLELLEADVSAVLEDLPGEGLTVRAAAGERVPPPDPGASAGSLQIFEQLRDDPSPLTSTICAASARSELPSSRPLGCEA